MKLTRFSTYSDAYRACLLANVTKSPASYANAPTDPNLIQPYVDKIAGRMLAAIQNDGVYAVGWSDTFKAAAKSLGIKPTKQALKEFLEA